MSHTCKWITSQPSEFPARHCGLSVFYSMKRDDDGNMRRQYPAFCAYHTKMAARQDADEAAGDALAETLRDV